MVSEVDLNLTDADFKRVCAIVYRHCGVALDERKRDLVRARIARQVRSNGFTSASEYLDYALADLSHEAFTHFIDSISTNLTCFFREREHFDYLTTNYLPRLLAEKEARGDRRIRAWSAACSTGEEPYSLAMKLLNTVGRRFQDDIRILATDISTRVLRGARAAVYREEQLSNVPEEYLHRYFNKIAAPKGSRPLFQASSQIREIVRFRHLNLIDAWPFSGPFDFVFCRNVMIYFDKQTRERLVGRLWDCLRPGGLLFTGHSESLAGIEHRFLNRNPSIYEKQ